MKHSPWQISTAHVHESNMLMLVQGTLDEQPSAALFQCYRRTVIALPKQARVGWPVLTLHAEVQLTIAGMEIDADLVASVWALPCWVAAARVGS